MSVRQSAPGATRSSPHCRAKILESAAICPACKKYLRFEPGAAARAVPTFSPLKVEASVRHPDVGEAWEYSVVVVIKNEKQPREENQTEKPGWKPEIEEPQPKPPPDKTPVEG